MLILALVLPAEVALMFILCSQIYHARWNLTRMYKKSLLLATSITADPDALTELEQAAPLRQTDVYCLCFFRERVKETHHDDNSNNLTLCVRKIMALPERYDRR